MLLEVIATTVRDAVLAEQSGADRIELITGVLEGGLTPSYGLIEEVVHRTSVPVQVMIRPHSQSFCYNESDLITMIKDIQTVKHIGAHGIVLGTLTADRRIDHEILRQLLDEAEGLSVTFHRAFDEVSAQEMALEELRSYRQIDRILTSGGKSSVLDAQVEIRKLVQQANQSHLQILAGSGLSVDTIPAFLRATGVKEIHFGRGVRVDNNPINDIDPNKIKTIKRLLKDHDSTG
ncbi:copper homeostasis protein CutC [Paenibacillus sp. SYP-B3998]|uniref:PF03932 family protein CutC n=1 Tax=Paenibacillus sp. SYP-B3998 TaxID=2678564 RepID=A0A6G4A1Z2_9BACL|nr:copper homeostasis protein CutC [Paenibacillus sp. SYP-B3998]NEW08350.1 copper homeostasis protein CutC [Paenibacillus sp. SYP-B3998]